MIFDRRPSLSGPDKCKLHCSARRPGRLGPGAGRRPRVAVSNSWARRQRQAGGQAVRPGRVRRRVSASPHWGACGRPPRQPWPPIRSDGDRIDAAQLSGPGPRPGGRRGRCPTVWPECPLPAARPSVDCDTLRLARTHWQPACPVGLGPTGPPEFHPSQPEPEWQRVSKSDSAVQSP